MSSSLLVSEDSKEDGQGNVSTAASSSLDCISHHHSSGFKERNYLGLSDCSSVDSSTVPSVIEDQNNILNMKGTELRLGLPGSQSPDRESNLCLSNSGKLDERPLFPLLPTPDGICTLSQKNIVSGNKRGFSDTLDRYSEVKSSPCNEGKWKLQTETEFDTPKTMVQTKLPNKSPINVMLSPRPPCSQPPVKKEVPNNLLKDQARAVNGTTHNHTDACNNSGSAPDAKAQVVGWPPIRSFRKITLATPSKINDEVDRKPIPAALFVKVSMDGAPYLRKVDLRTYSTYQGLSSALEKMFGWLTLDQGKSQGGQGKEMFNEGKITDLINGSEYVLTYEDKDGDWMLVGDVPWEMFVESCKRLKIMKGADAIGLAAPRVNEGVEEQDLNGFRYR